LTFTEEAKERKFMKLLLKSPLVCCVLDIVDVVIVIVMTITTVPLTCVMRILENVFTWRYPVMITIFALKPQEDVSIPLIAL